MAPIIISIEVENTSGKNCMRVRRINLAAIKCEKADFNAESKGIVNSFNQSVPKTAFTIITIKISGKMPKISHLNHFSKTAAFLKNQPRALLLRKTASVRSRRFRLNNPQKKDCMPLKPRLPFIKWRNSTRLSGRMTA